MKSVRNGGGNVGRWQKEDRCCQVWEDIGQVTDPPPGMRCEVDTKKLCDALTRSHTSAHAVNIYATSSHTTQMAFREGVSSPSFPR